MSSPNDAAAGGRRCSARSASGPLRSSPPLLCRASGRMPRSPSSLSRAPAVDDIGDDMIHGVSQHQNRDRIATEAMHLPPSRQVGAAGTLRTRLGTSASEVPPIVKAGECVPPSPCRVLLLRLVLDPKSSSSPLAPNRHRQTAPCRRCRSCQRAADRHNLPRLARATSDLCTPLISTSDPSSLSLDCSLVTAADFNAERKTLRDELARMQGPSRDVGPMSC